MPVPKSQRGQPITQAAFESPMETSIVRFGLKGLNLTDAIDAIEPDELTRMLNVTHRQDGQLTSRLGQTSIVNTTVGTNNHSIRRLNDPENDDWSRLYGIDSALYQGQSTRTLRASGFSGSPLTLLPYRPPFNGESWMFVADTNKMVKVRHDGLTLPLGLPKPASIATTALATEQKTTIADFTSDGTQYSNWTGNKGYTYDNPPVLIDGTEITAVVDDDSAPGANFGALKTTPTLAGYYAFYGVPRTVDMSKTGAAVASDDDYIHLKLNFSHTQYIKEFRVYLVCSAAFSPSVMPGFSDASGANSDAYVKAFSANDFAAYIQAQLTQIDAAELARIRSLRDDNLSQSTPHLTGARTDYQKTHFGNNTTTANQDIARTITETTNAASDQWQGFGIVGIPLRRGDWQRIGTTTGRDWSTITGIIVYIQTGPSGQSPTGTVAVRMSNLYMTGGSGPDSGEPAASPFDYVYTNYDPRTGAEGNPSAEQLATNYLDSLRRTINVTPAAYSDSNILQRFYRRGGSLPTDWYFVGTNSANGGVFADTNTDTEAAAAGSVENSNYQPVPTVDDDGDTILAQPLSSIWGPLQDLIFGCGDPYRPGYIYFCKPGNPDSWPDDSLTEVCSPSEEILTGCLYGGQSFAFSGEHCFVLYPNFSSDSPTVTSTITQCTRGLVSRWALATGISGMYFIASDGIYRTSGGPEDWISKDIDPLFNGMSKNGVAAIDLTDLEAMRLEIFENELYFQYHDSNGSSQCLVYSIPYQFWRQYTFGRATSAFYTDEGNAEPTLLMGAESTGRVYSYSGTNDDGLDIQCGFRTGAVTFGSPRFEKRFGDQMLDIDGQGNIVTLQNFLNYETVTDSAQVSTLSSGRKRVIYDGFGDTPQRGNSISTNISWASNSVSPIVYQLGNTIIIEPEITINRVTQWDDLNSPDASYIMGVTFDCDTGGVDRTIIVEGDYLGAITTIATLTVNTDGRHKVKFSWAGVRANKVRLRPDDDCLAWQLFKCDWISQAEPPAIATWDSYFENGWDQYYTGLDLFCDTFGQTKTIEMYVDGVLILTDTVNNNGRLVKHFTLPWGRGHVFRFVATDLNPGVLYDFRWQLQVEPSEQTNWNSNFTTQSALYDKYLKAVIFECDTFGEDKVVTVECDGVVVETLTINADGRKVVQKSFPQHLGRVFRVYPTDAFPSRLYSLQFQFDGEPLALDRWETQESTLGVDGWSYATYGQITVKSNDAVTLTITAYNQSGVATVKTYTIPGTSGLKIKNFVPFEAVKGILHKFTLTADSPFWLYQSETTLYIRAWGSDTTAVIHPFGDSDVDPTRNMVSSQLAAARPGGEA